MSGIGWILDFSTYCIITNITPINVMFANMISAIPATTYVFIMSNKKIFKDNNHKISLKTKYLIYFGYQIILVSLVSILGELLYNLFINKVTIKLVLKYLKILVKILITPITMTLNFIVMKCLIEKL